MNVELLVSVMNKDIDRLIRDMHMETDAVIIDQCGNNGYEERQQGNARIRKYSCDERGIGRSRNRAIDYSEGDICVFSDEDIVYEPGYEEKIVREFNALPDADFITFNIEVDVDRFTYRNTDRHRVKWYNCARYGAVSFAVRGNVLRSSGIRFSELFGGGAKYLNGEDSIFLKEIIDRGYRVYASPVTIGREINGSESSWFSGIDERFYHDRGVLYAVLYGFFAKPFGIRWLVVGKNVRTENISFLQAFKFFSEGVREGRRLGK